MKISIILSQIQLKEKAQSLKKGSCEHKEKQTHIRTQGWVLMHTHINKNRKIYLGFDMDKDFSQNIHRNSVSSTFSGPTAFPNIRKNHTVKLKIETLFISCKNIQFWVPLFMYA